MAATTLKIKYDTYAVLRVLTSQVISRDKFKVRCKWMKSRDGKFRFASACISP